jgi:hypothetical protein
MSRACVRSSKPLTSSAGLLTPGSSRDHRLPTRTSSDRLVAQFPVTAAGPYGIFTRFPNTDED